MTLVRDVFDTELVQPTVRDVFSGGILIPPLTPVENLDGALLAEDGSVLLAENGTILVYEQAENIF